jgi:antitoxin component HigA of HigAB toxin-antitoxin module
MKNELKPIRSEKDYEKSLAEVERLGGAKSGTPEGDHCGVSASEIETNLDTVSQVVSRKCFRGGVTDTPVSAIAAQADMTR